MERKSKITREEEIIETSKLIYSPSSGVPQSLSMRVGFIEGAKWADKTIIEKACKWLLEGGYFINNTETIDDFKRAMEE